MSIFTKKLLIPLVLIGTVGLVGTGTGIYFATFNNQVESNIDKQENSEANNNINNQPIQPNVELVNLKTLKAQINQDKVVINALDEKQNNKVDLTKTLTKSNIYAFNVKNHQLNLANVSIPDSVTWTIKLDESKNKIVDLNNGKLHVIVTLFQTGNNPENVELEINGFKGLDETFSKLFDTNDKTLLKIDPKMGSDNDSYATIEKLNAITVTKVSNPSALITNHNEAVVNRMSSEQENKETSISGLTTWLRNDSSKMNDAKEVSIYGQVKLEKIETESDSKTYFYLTSANVNNPLRLLSNKDGKVIEALIGTIKTTNLLASDISVIPINHTETETRTYIDDLLSTNKQDNKGYSNQIEVDKALNKELSVDLAIKDQEEERRISDVQTTSNILFIKPYLLNKNPTMQDKKLGVNISISFGSGINAKTYNTANDKDIQTLTKAEFKFSIYSKKLTKTEIKLEAKEFRDMMLKLNETFKQENYMKPVTKPTSNGFKEMNIETTNLKSPIEVELENVAMDNASANYLLFATYSYKGLDNMNKVGISPCISLIHAKKMN